MSQMQKFKTFFLLLAMLAGVNNFYYGTHTLRPDFSSQTISGRPAQTVFGLDISREGHYVGSRKDVRGQRLNRRRFTNDHRRNTNYKNSFLARDTLLKNTSWGRWLGSRYWGRRVSALDLHGTRTGNAPKTFGKYDASNRYKHKRVRYRGEAGIVL